MRTIFQRYDSWVHEDFEAALASPTLTPRDEREIYRYIRKAGWVPYLAVKRDGSKMGVATHRDELAQLREWYGYQIYTGYTHDKAAHKLGGSDARRGWRMFLFGEEVSE